MRPSQGRASAHAQLIIYPDSGRGALFSTLAHSLVMCRSSSVAVTRLSVRPTSLSIVARSGDRVTQRPDT
jgi:hypothetical protein